MIMIIYVLSYQMFNVIHEYKGYVYAAQQQNTALTLDTSQPSPDQTMVHL
jgi:hypothetical protein